MGKGRKTILISGFILAFLVGTMVAAPQASAANPVLTFLQTTIVDLLNTIQTTVSGNSDKLDDIDTRLANIESILTASCGDGTVDSGETCDDGADNGSYGFCNATCDSTLECGDGAVNGPEECDDGNTNSGDGCSSACILEDPCAGVFCDDGNSCTSDACIGGVCTFTSDDATACDDGDPCTTSDICNAGVCGGAAKDCSALDGECALGVCNPASGICFANNLSVATACGDITDDSCTDPDICDGAGNCLPNHEPLGTACIDDATFCNGTENCDGNGSCFSGGDPCFGLVCNEADDFCQTDFSGFWSILPTVSYTCAFGIVDFSFSQIIVDNSNPNISFATSGNPNTMVGTITGADFTASHSIPGSCEETYTITGTFTGTNSFTADFTAEYVGLECSGLGLDPCIDQSFSFTGNR